MNDDDFRNYAKYYDRIYLNMKNYQKEAMILNGIIEQNEKKKSKTLLDVGCGTGEHLKHLSAHYRCTGVDVNRQMVETAKKKVPDATFKVANMMTFSLDDKFDVLTCLFSAIGYVESFNNLVKTLGNFHNHLHDNGIAIVEPWIFRKDFKKGFIGLDTYEDENLKLARMGTSKLKDERWLIFLHYLIGEGGEIKYVKEVHKMVALDYDDYTKAFTSTRFKDTKFLTENLWDRCRGLFVAYK